MQFGRILNTWNFIKRSIQTDLSIRTDKNLPLKYNIGNNIGTIHNIGNNNTI